MQCLDFEQVFKLVDALFRWLVSAIKECQFLIFLEELKPLLSFTVNDLLLASPTVYPVSVYFIIFYDGLSCEIKSFIWVKHESFLNNSQ